MAKIFFIPIMGLLMFVLYQLYNEDIKVEDIREYNHDVTIYTKPDCVFCKEAKKILIKKNIPYKEIDLTWDNELVEEIHKKTGSNTVPVIFIKDQYIGGYQELLNLDKLNKLDDLLKNDEDESLQDSSMSYSGSM